MSSLYLALALLGTFGAVVAAGSVAQAAIASRRRSLEILQSTVGEVPNLRTQQLAEPFLDRVLVPLVAALGQFAKRVTPIGMRERIARQLVLGGSPERLDADKVAAMKLFGAIGGSLLGLAVGFAFGWSPPFVLVAMGFMAAIVYLMPGAGLGQRAINRQEAIRLALPDMMDLLTLSVEAGLGFDAALQHVRRNVPGPLSDEVGRFLQEIQLGVSRTEAFRHLADRSDVQELKGFVIAMIQADTFGISVGKVLRSQAKELRLRRRQRAEELALKMPVKLLFPLIIGILPATLLAIGGPGIIRVMQTIFGLKV
jgi:tight adherence protein C